MRRLIFLIILLMSSSCFALQKNVASQKWVVFAFDITDNSAKTGDAAQITANVRIDGAAADAVDDTNPTELEDGYYIFDITATESNGDSIVICPASSTANIQVIGTPMAVWTTPANFPSTSIDSNGRLDIIKVAGTTQTANDNGADINAVLADTSAFDTSAECKSLIFGWTFLDLAAGAPAYNADAATGINYLYEAWRNRYVSNTTGGIVEGRLYRDDGVTILCESNQTDDGTDFVREELGAED